MSSTTLLVYQVSAQECLLFRVIGSSLTFGEFSSAWLSFWGDFMSSPSSLTRLRCPFTSRITEDKRNDANVIDSTYQCVYSVCETSMIRKERGGERCNIDNIT